MSDKADTEIASHSGLNVEELREIEEAIMASVTDVVIDAGERFRVVFLGWAGASERALRDVSNYKDDLIAEVVEVTQEIHWANVAPGLRYMEDEELVPEIGSVEIELAGIANTATALAALVQRAFIVIVGATGAAVIINEVEPVGEVAADVKATILDTTKDVGDTVGDAIFKAAWPIMIILGLLVWSKSK
jgi:hypothetical protein